MAADGTVNIDVVLHKDQAQQASKELDQVLKDTGKSAGDKAEKNIENNVQKASEETKKLVTNINRWVDEKGQIHIDVDKQRADESIEKFKERIKRVPKNPKIKPEADTDSANEKIDGLQKKVTKIPKEVKTNLVAQAKEQGITNFDQLLKKIPKKQLTELVAKAQKGEVINYEEELRKLPAKLVTEVKLNNQAALPLKELQQQANQTSQSFSHLKEIVAGSFIGGIAVNGIHAVGNSLREAARAGMEYNVEQDRMKTVWTALTTEAPRDGKVLVNYINDMAQHSIYAADTIDKMAQSFYHVHSSVKETKDWTNAFIRLGSTLHMSNDQLSEAGEQFAKIVAGGKANAEDMSVMINRFPMFGEALQKATGKSMKQLYELSSQGKLTAKDFTEALDYLSNKYKGSTEEAMTSFTGMSMYIKSRWQVLWGEVMSTSFKANKQMSEDIRDLLSDQMISRYSKMMGQALASLLRGSMNLLEYIGQHKDTLVDLIGNLGKITGIIGATVWHAFIDTIKIIATALGLVKDNGDAAIDPLKLLDDVTKALVRNKSGLEAFTRVLVALFAVKKITQFVMWMAKARDAVLSFAAAQKAVDFIGGAGPKAPIAGPASIAGETAGSAGVAMTRREMLVAGAKNLGGFAKRVSPYAAGAVMVGTELFSNNSASAKTGGVLGTIGGAAGGKALGAAIGTMIAPGIGTTVGGILGGTVGSWAGQKLGEALGRGADEHFKAHPVTVKAKYTTSTDNKAMDKKLTPDINKVNKTVLRMDVDSESIQKAQQKTDKYFDEMSKKVDSYYKKKAEGYKKDEEASKKNLDQLVKAGKMTQAEEDKALKKQQENDQKKIKNDETAAKKRKNVLEQMRKDTNDYYSKVSKIENDATKSEKQKQKEIQKAQADYVKKQYQDQLKANKKITSYAKQGADTQEKIYKDLIKEKGKLSKRDLNQTQRNADKQYQAAVKPAKKARNEIVKEAKKEYNDTVKTAKKEYKEHHTISKRKYKEIVANAKAQRDGVVNAAEDEYKKTTKSATDQHKKVSKEIEDQKNDVNKSAMDEATGHISASETEMQGVNSNYSSGYAGSGKIWNKFLDSVKSVLKFFQQSTKDLPSMPVSYSYATGTGALKENQLALVGEEGFELAHTPRGYEVLGADGPELRYLSAGTSILTHAQSTAAMAMNGGKLPGYAKGTGAKIADFVDSAKDGIEDAFDLIGKGAGEIWDWLKEKTGLDKLLDAQSSMGGVKRTTKGSFEYAKDAIGKFIKKMADKFIENFGGAVTGDHKKLMAAAGIPASWFSAIDYIVTHESGWRVNATNPSSGAYGLPQSLPGSKMASAGSDWRTNPITQLKWMKNYVGRYGGGPGAAAFWRAHHWYANGGWTNRLSFFGEVPDEPEVAINPKRDTSEDHIAEAIEARAKINPNGFAGTLSKLIESAKNSANNLVPVINQGTGQVKTASSVASRSAKIDGNLNVVMNVDGKTIGHITYATWRAIRSHEVNIQANGGAIPVGGAQPLGGVY